MGLLGSSRAEALPAITAQISRLERPEHAPLSPTGTHGCLVVYTRAASVPCSRERERDYP